MAPGAGDFAEVCSGCSPDHTSGTTRDTSKTPRYSTSNASRGTNSYCETGAPVHTISCAEDTAATTCSCAAPRTYSISFSSTTADNLFRTSGDAARLPCTRPSACAGESVGVPSSWSCTATGADRCKNEAFE